MTRRTAIITGASRGLGATIAGFLAPQGYRLVLTARGRDPLQRLAGEIAPSTDVVAVAGDVTDPAHRAALIEAAGGRIDLLVNNASELGPIAELRTVTEGDMRSVIEANLIAPVALTTAATPGLQRARGLVVNLTSDAARAGYATWGVYGASKAALELATLTLAAELRDREIGVVSVDPGDLRTKMHQDAFPGEDISDRPLPEVTIPFWAWLLGQDPLRVSGSRFEAQAEAWEVAA